jgi:hypothetical protein
VKPPAHVGTTHQWVYIRPVRENGMRSKATALVVLFFLSLLVPLTPVSSAQEVEDIVILNTAVNPTNNHTYHLLSESSWTVAAEVARGLDGFLVTVDDETENQWLFDTFASFDNQSRHLWTGLSDADNDGGYRWHNGAPFYYRNWGADQPSASDDEGYVHIASTNMGNIMPGTWNDLEVDPQYFPVYGVVEVGAGADYSLRFADDGDRVEIPHSPYLNISDSLAVSAWVNPASEDGIQFITMKGDYGWGMYLNGGTLAYASEYSLSQHPTANQSITVGEWSHLEIDVIEGVGGEFRINGIPAGTIAASQALIPAGNFGSNDCFTSGDPCDELFIASMGAGCDCNYFSGMLDNVSIGTNFSFIGDAPSWVSNWTFPEGEGMSTADLHSNNSGTIFGADWVMPDGTIVAQVVQVSNNVEVEGISGQAGDNLLFYADLDEMTKNVFFNLYPNEFKNEEIIIDVYFGNNRIPSSWDNDGSIEALWGYAWEQYSWPEAGGWWVLLVPQTDIEDYSMMVSWEVADPPPSVDEMTELNNGIPVTGQTIEGGRQVDFEDRVLYYYVDVEENLSSLTVSTYGGSGNIDIGLSWGTVPDPFDFWFIEEPFGNGDQEDNNPNQGKIVYDSGQGNEQDATLYNVEPGRYYATAYTYQRAMDFTIVASMVFAPENTAPEDAVELTPGVAYGPLTGYDGLNQYFKIEVPTGTERLEVDLAEGYGEATMFMRLEQFPSQAEFDVQSSTPGAGDKIGFNDPTPGTWYILLNTEDVFANLMITASFEDRYIWSYDGTPIELFNGEEINGLEAPAGESLQFFVELDNPGSYLEVKTFGGQGTLELEGLGSMFVGFFPEDDGDAEGRQGRPMDGLTTEEVEVTSFGEGTEHTLYVQMPANGRFDITLTVYDEISDVSIMAIWEDSQLPPIDPVEPNPDENIEIFCEDEAREVFEITDADGDGVIDEREFTLAEGDSPSFDSIDLNGDGMIEFREALQEICTCENEILIIASQISPLSKGVPLVDFKLFALKNTYDWKALDVNADGVLDSEELEIASIICETTYDAFDGDGDGVPDDDDAFPEDPDESKDSDGDGVGDNADLAPSVANELIYGSLGLVALGVTIVLFIGVFGAMRGNRNGTSEWDELKQQDIASQMLGLDNQSSLEATVPDEGTSLYAQDSQGAQSSELFAPPTAVQSDASFTPQMMGQTSETVPSMDAFADLLSTPSPAIQQPSQQLMGMLDAQGAEVLEYPAGSGSMWTRASPTDTWNQA